MNDKLPHYANVTVPFRYVQELPVLARKFNIELILPVVVSSDSTEANFTIAGSHEAVFRFVTKLADERSFEYKALLGAKQEEAKRSCLISKDNVTDVKILVNVSATVEEFIRRI